jgi:hypothetical protein
MTQTYPLTVTRNRGWYGKARKLALFAQTPAGKVRLGDVKSGQSVTVDVPQDATEIYGKMDWAKSEVMDLSFVNPGETIYANLWFSLNPARMFGVPTLPCAIESTPR